MSAVGPQAVVGRCPLFCVRPPVNELKMTPRDAEQISICAICQTRPQLVSHEIARSSWQRNDASLAEPL